MNTAYRPTPFRLPLTSLLVSTAALLSVWSCGSEEGGPRQGEIVRNPLNEGNSTDGAGTTDTGGGAGGNAGGAVDPVTPIDPGGIENLPAGTSTGVVQECASSSQPTSLQGVTLIFGFDVSASMASDDVARQFKWEPVALAAKTFFASAAAQDVSAQLTFFPSENAGTFTPTPTAPPADADAGGGGFGGGGFGGGGFGGGGMTTPGSASACTVDDYADPDIPLTVLPSDLFGTTIDATEPNRLGTPTRWILPAIIDQAIALKATTPSNYAVVLVTDGLPTDCTPVDDNIQQVAALAAAGPAAGIPVYVIGVATPDGATIGAGEDGIGNLNQVAVEGGTEAAFIIDTGDVDKTVADFVSVIETIKESTFSCNMPIPEPPPGQTFDASKVNVAFKTDTQTDMVYSPDCSAQWGWHYDDEANPTSIILCESACGSVKSFSSTTGSVDIQFGCERRVINK